MPQTTPDVLAAAIKCFHLNTGQIFPEFIVIHSPHAALFAVTTISSHRLRQASQMNQDWEIAINLHPRYILQLMGTAEPQTNDLEAASASTIAANASAPPPESFEEIPTNRLEIAPDPDLAPAGAITEGHNASGA